MLPMSEIMEKFEESEGSCLVSPTQCITNIKLMSFLVDSFCKAYVYPVVK